MLEVKNLRKSYGKRMILNGINLHTSGGSCIGIVGRNGCGKTTLLSILAGAQRADSGSILLDGQEALHKPKLFAGKVAYVPQENPLMAELSVHDNLLLWYRGSKKALEQDLEEGPAMMLGMKGLLKQRAGTLSGGQKKRLSIACALSDHAPVLVMDEAGAALDLECKEEIQTYLKEYLRGGGAVVLTSHELEELELCTEMHILKDGNLKQVASGLSAKELIEAFR